MTTNKWFLSILGVLALSAPALAWAQDPSSAVPVQQTKFETSIGVVESFVDQTLIISDGAGQRMTFVLDPETKVPASLQKGQSVRIDWKKGDGGERLAVAVTVVNKPTDLLSLGRET
jgi:hypothetical protein